MDLLDKILLQKRDLVDKVLSEKKDAVSKVSQELSPSIRAYVKASIPKITLPPSIQEAQVANLIKEAISRIPVVKPAKEVIREIKTIEKTKEDPKLKDLEVKIVLLEEVIERLKENLVFGARIAPAPVISSGGSGSSSSGTNPFYIGDATTEGSWRFYNDGTNLLVQRLESGLWNEKGSFLS